MSVKIYGCFGNIFDRKDKYEDASSHVNHQPSSPYAKSIIHSLVKKTDKELLDRAFRTVKISRYGDFIYETFRRKTGETINHQLDNWYDLMSGKDVLIEAIKYKLIKEHPSFHLNKGYIDLSNEIRKNFPSFRISFVNLSEMIAIGGIQEVEVIGEISGQKFGFDYWDRNGKIHNQSHNAKINLTILLKDWFGVDEGDFINNRPPAILDREGLASLWILQHQRGYKPFVHIFKYRCMVDITLGLR